MEHIYTPFSISLNCYDLISTPFFSLKVQLQIRSSIPRYSLADESSSHDPGIIVRHLVFTIREHGSYFGFDAPAFEDPNSISQPHKLYTCVNNGQRTQCVIGTGASDFGTPLATSSRDLGVKVTFPLSQQTRVDLSWRPIGSHSLPLLAFLTALRGQFR